MSKQSLNKKANGSQRAKFSQMSAALMGLARVEALIQEKFKSEAPQLSKIPAYLFELGGKRIRPVLSLLTAQALGMSEPSQPLIDVAAGIELIHMATLLHDDIIDKSPLRRHNESPFLRYGIGDTLLAGDFLLVRAFSLCAHLDTFIIDATEKACIELTEGEILEVPLNLQEHTLDSSLNISRKKTASLFRLATETAAFIAAQKNENVTKAFARFGEELGIAFQILDDILDVVSTEEQLGKKAGIDIRERKPSPVNVLWLKTGSSLGKKLLLGKEDATDSEIEAALREIKESSVIEDSSALARGYAESALHSLQDAELQFGYDFEPTAHEALTSLVAYVLERME